jgi:hypothetical protein
MYKKWGNARENGVDKTERSSYNKLSRLQFKMVTKQEGIKIGIHKKLR